MKKRIAFKISTQLGEDRFVQTIGISSNHCFCLAYNNYPHCAIAELWNDEVDGSYPSGIFNAGNDKQVIGTITEGSYAEEAPDDCFIMPSQNSGFFHW